ncbi:MAG: hypothetical protein KGN84_17510 [Acidobacteriota bacterium]|nr:hypothetical protein [Acidobacteriota bacterium]
MAPILGRMLVALAGGYVLRALTELGILPAAAGVPLGLVYGFLWLGLAARSARKGSFVVAVYSSTSVLILAPLMWEAMVRLRVLSSAAGALVLVLYAFAALGIAGKARMTIPGAISSLAAILLALMLLLARHDATPFAATLLLVSAGLEFAAFRDVRVGARTAAALSAAAGVLVWSWLMAGSGGMPETWVHASSPALLAAQIALAAIYLTSAVLQSIFRRLTLTRSEIAHTAISLLAGMGGAVWVFHADRPVMFALGVAALAGGIACYAVSFRLFENQSKGNFRAWATFGLLLVLVGIALPFSQSGFWLLCAACAIVCCWTALRFHLPTLALHGAIYYAVAAAVAGATFRSFSVLLGDDLKPASAWPSMVVLVSGMAAWAAIARLAPEQRVGRRNQIASAAIWGHMVWIVAGLIASLPGWGVLGTLILAGTSVALAWGSRQWGRAEFVWLVYAFMAMGAWKLVARDFREEHNAALVISLFSYGGALIVLPKMLRSNAPVAPLTEQKADRHEPAGRRP